MDICSQYIAINWGVEYSYPVGMLSRQGWYPCIDSGVEYSYPVGMLSRCGAATYARVSVMLFYTRNAQPSHVRSALVAGFGVACLTLAALGVIEFVTGHARIDILTAVFIEIAIAMTLWYANKEKAVTK